MSTFSVDNLASEAIRRIFGRFKGHDPVAEIIGVGYPTNEEASLRTIQIPAHDRSGVPNGELCDVDDLPRWNLRLSPHVDRCLAQSGRPLTPSKPLNAVGIVIQEPSNTTITAKSTSNHLGKTWILSDRATLYQNVVCFLKLGRVTNINAGGQAGRLSVLPIFLFSRELQALYV